MASERRTPLSPFEEYCRKVRESADEKQQSTGNYQQSESPQIPLPAVVTNSQRCPQPARNQRHSKHEILSESKPLYCENDSCPYRVIEPNEEPGRGPSGITLCRKCYRRYKLEKKQAREEQRRVTDVWKSPRRKRTLGKEVDGTQLKVNQQNEDSLSPSREAVDAFGSPYYFPPVKSQADLVPRHEVINSPTITDLSSNQLSLTEIDVEKSGNTRLFETPKQDVESHGFDEPSNHGVNRRQHDPSIYEEAEFYKYSRMEEGRDRYAHKRSCCCSAWTFRQKCMILGVSFAILSLIVVLVAVAITKSHHRYDYTPSFLQVNNTLAFDSHGATKSNVNDTNDGLGAGNDKYIYYSGNSSNFPSPDKWVSFNQMWQANLEIMQLSCSRLQQGKDNSPEVLQDLYDAIQNRANASLVDHRLILAVVLQESKGCVRVRSTTSYGGVRNPGLMQSHNGHSYDARYSRLSILSMIQDGTQGTAEGEGLVQLLNSYGDPYKAARAYNSGYIPTSGDLSEAAGATACYVSDIANRLTGWVTSESTCQG